MLLSEKDIELSKASKEWAKKEDGLLDDYMRKLENEWEKLKLTYRIPQSMLGFKDEFELFVELEIESDATWEKLGKADAQLCKLWRQTLSSLKDDWREKQQKNAKDYEARKYR